MDQLPSGILPGGIQVYKEPIIFLEAKRREINGHPTRLWILNYEKDEKVRQI